ncbi:hypothetical protein GCM10010094_27870 [Streptomyces flaveus]|uniref:Uncharacterized protein n=1 Tax=Streptomyces flaveus TaxID=66370 RepID=A0A917QS85_9ACTN|nr:hypothetical protein GCM10010094_27870 [Streptomyces flaveus]
MTEIGAGEAQADGRVRAEAVARLHDDETAPGTHEGSSRVQKFMKCVTQGRRADHPLGQFVQRREIGHPAGETVLENGSWGVWSRGRRGTRGGRRGRDSVCGARNR